MTDGQRVPGTAFTILAMFLTFLCIFKHYLNFVLFTPTIDGSTFLKSSSSCLLLLLHLCRDRGKGVVGNCREACVGMKGAGVGRQAAVGQAVVGQALEAKGRDGVVGQGGGCRMVVGGGRVVEKWRCDRVCGEAVWVVRHTVVAGDVECEYEFAYEWSG